MNVPTTLAAYALVLLVVLAGGLGLGRAVGPVGTAGTPSSTHESGPEGSDPATHEEDR